MSMPMAVSLIRCAFGALQSLSFYTALSYKILRHRPFKGQFSDNSKSISRITNSFKIINGKIQAIDFRDLVTEFKVNKKASFYTGFFVLCFRSNHLSLPCGCATDVSTTLNMTSLVSRHRVFFDWRMSNSFFKERKTLARIKSQVPKRAGNWYPPEGRNSSLSLQNPNRQSSQRYSHCFHIPC